MRILLFLFLLITCFSCSDSDAVEPDQRNIGALEHKFGNQISADDLSVYNDLFIIDSVYIQGTEVWVDVAYGGGCQEHEFMVAWPAGITYINTPDFEVTLYHNANDDLCRAFIHETIKIDLTDTPVGKFGRSTIAEIRLTVVNGSRPEGSKSTR